MNVFERHADRYEQWFECHPGAYCSEVAAVGEILDLASPQGRGLEIGTGTGRFSTPFGITEGVEPAAAMRQIAQARGVRVRDAVAEALPYGDAEFDIALMITTICFVNDPLKACQEAWRVLKSAGRLIIGLVDRDSPLGRGYEERREESLFYREARFFSASEVVTMMSKVGFSAFQYRQTLFHVSAAAELQEPVLPGYGRGGFVVIAGRKQGGRAP